MISNSTSTSSSSSAAAVNGPMSPSSGANPLKTYFKTPEGRYKLHSEKTHPSGLLPYAHGKSVTQITLAQLKERSAQGAAAPSSSYTASGGVRYVAARFLGSGNGSRGLSFVGGNGTSKANGGATRSGSLGGLNGTSPMINSNFDGKGTFLLFNVGDTLYVSDLNSQDKDPIKAMHFSNSNPVCHAFDSESKDGHDLIIGLNSGDVYSVSLRQQLQDVGKKIVGAQHYNKEGSTDNSRCTSVAWIPGRDGAFVVAHADGNVYVYEKSKDGTVDASFPIVKDQTQFSVSHAKSSKSNPVARWHICQGSVNNIAFSADGKYLATVGRDGYLRVFDYSSEQLICGSKSYYGALLCCAWSGDGKYILTGGEDDLVQVWSMDDKKVVAWGEGHNSWVSGVAFDSYWSPPTSEDTGENGMYRFGSVGQDTQLMLWDFSMGEIVLPLRRCPPGGSPTFSAGSQSSHWDSAVTVEESVLTACREGQVKIWMRPGHLEQTSNSKPLPGSSLKEKTLPSSRFSASSYK
ncbi:hypothetical protein Vadar_019303 [Vaccinium darrowii]|uniref:Uncharacterized protein n=1 Tax=Vaccinium darrowii TaxID=229202 RepID=A0ACB7ZCF0_9ERIC|nr:hypothetical protein Vadar_019303 [Vaccinium darrowii]